ncbi:MAG: ATP-binding protein [Lachnospiraceae bacterium]|nr:ATP-binding protein [Lachnospiraceae bacterium]
MMRDFSMHFMDIVQNSIKADAKNIIIKLNENVHENLFEFSVSDDGKGMTDEQAKKAISPFFTSRTTRKVGLGLPLLNQTCMTCNGKMSLESTPGVGTTVTATMEYDHIDRPPLGNVGETLFILIITNMEIDFKYIHNYNSNKYILDTKEIKEVLEGVPLNSPDVMSWLRANIKEGLEEIRHG